MDVDQTTGVPLPYASGTYKVAIDMEIDVASWFYT